MCDDFMIAFYDFDVFGAHGLIFAFHYLGSLAG
jgi:hypothetical protein